MKKTTGNDFAASDYEYDDLVFQAPIGYVDLNNYIPYVAPVYTFSGKVKKWTVVSPTEGVLVVDPIIGSLKTDVTYGASSDTYFYNRSKFSSFGFTSIRSAADVYSNNRFQASETLTSTRTAKTFTVSATNPYTALSSVVVFANTVNTFAYGVAVNSAAAFAAANNVGPQIAPAFNKANNALANSSGTFAGSLSITGNGWISVSDLLICITVLIFSKLNEAARLWAASCSP